MQHNALLTEGGRGGGKGILAMAFSKRGFPHIKAERWSTRLPGKLNLDSGQAIVLIRNVNKN